MKKFLHAVAALLTVVMFLVRRHCVMARICQAKRSSFEPPCPQGSQKSMPPAQECRFCARQAATAAITTCAAMPKYKRDPDIQIDDEHIGVHPRV